MGLPANPGFFKHRLAGGEMNSYSTAWRTRPPSSQTELFEEFKSPQLLPAALPSFENAKLDAASRQVRTSPMGIVAGSSARCLVDERDHNKTRRTVFKRQSDIGCREARGTVHGIGMTEWSHTGSRLADFARHAT